ncbi:MAG: LacI family DNA-binding transcriptional regulator [Lachnospiraceae bacterium]|nr:LacI family DNA-binding transcriptional regulator [Lachnospiraceae bacterium]
MKLDDIAIMAGVSKSTVSRALANSPKIKESTRKRIQALAAEHNYQPNSLAQAVASKHSGILGFCLLKKEHPSFGHPFFGPVLDGAIQEAQKCGYHLILAANSGNHSFDEAFIKDAIDGVLLSSFSVESSMKEFQKRNIPQVIINDLLYSDDADFIIDENYRGGLAITNHLVHECGRKRIAVITDRLSHTSYLTRYKAYIDVLTASNAIPYSNSAFRDEDYYRDFAITSPRVLDELGLSDIPHFGTPILATGTRIEHGYICGKRLLATKDLPDAVFATADALAVGAMHAFQEAGIRIPEDIAIAGYDDVDCGRAAFPQLTTIQVNREEMGRAAVRALVERIHDPKSSSKTLYIPNKLIVRGSTLSRQ